MPFTTAELTAFFTQAGQMGLTAAQHRALAAEGLSTMDDFRDFRKEELLVAFKNLRDTYPIPTRITTRLLMASIAYHYYADTTRVVDYIYMHFTNVLREFNIEWKAIMSLKDQDNNLKLPTLS